MRLKRPPAWAWATLAGVVGLVLVLRLRARRNANRAAQDVYAGYPIAPIPVSFSYITDNAAKPGGTIPAPGASDAAALALLAQLSSALVSNATLLAGRVPRSVGVSSSTASSTRHPLITGARGDIAGQPGENRWYAETPEQLIAKGGTWSLHRGWQGPGTYEAEKFTDPYNAYTTGTEIVRIGP